MLGCMHVHRARTVDTVVRIPPLFELYQPLEHRRAAQHLVRVRVRVRARARVRVRVRIRVRVRVRVRT